MSFMDELRNLPEKSLGGTGKHFIDADTLKDEEGKTYRLEGFNAGEVDKIYDGKIKQGTAGGAVATDVIHSLANEQGFTNVVPKGGSDSEGFFGRQLAELTNDKGERFSQKLIEAGAFDINKFSTEQDIAARDLAEAERNAQKLAGTYTENEFDKAANMIKEAELAEGAKTLGFRINAENPREYAQYIDQVMADNPDMTREEAKKEAEGFLAPGVNTRIQGMSDDGRSLNPFSDSWDQGWKNVEAGAYGVLNMLGEETGWEGAAQYGEDNIERVNAELGQYGRTILDYTEVKDASSAFQYLGNNLALSLPQMGITAAAAFATGGASLGVQAAGLAVPAALYVGQTWNEMEGEKDAVWAIGAGIAQATLDKVGLNFITKGLSGDDILKKAVSELVKKGNSKQVAESMVSSASRRQIAQFTGAAAEQAKKQLAAKQLGKRLNAAVLKGGIGESITEAGQESIGYLAAVQGSDKQFDWDDYNNRIISAAIAGGSLGGSLSGAGVAYDTGAWADVAHRLAPRDDAAASDAERYAADEMANHGEIASTQEIANDARARFQQSPGVTLAERTALNKKAHSQKSFSDKASEKIFNPSKLWQGSVRNIFKPDVMRRSRAARQMADMFGGTLQKTFSGPTFENAKHHMNTIYKNMVPAPEQFYQNITGRGWIGAKEKARISDGLYANMRAAVNKDGDFDPNLVPDGPAKQMTIDMAKQMNALSDKMFRDQQKYNPELGYEKNYLMKYKAVNKGAIHKNKPGFVKALEANGFSRADANKLADELVENNQVTDIDEAFSIVQGGVNPGSHKGRTLKMSEKAEFKEFMEQDMFANIAAATTSASRFTAHEQFIGKDASVVSKLLDDMQHVDGVPEAEVNAIAAQMQDYFDAESGNYKRPTGEAAKRALVFQKNFMMISTLSALPLATVSSLVEMMLVNRGLRSDQIFGVKKKKGDGKTQGSLQSTFMEGAETLWAAASEISTAGFKPTKRETAGQEKIRELGYYDWDVGAATVTGVSEVNPWQQWVYEGFFKWTGLTGYTNFTRAARAGIATDYINDKLDTVFSQRNGGLDNTREVQEAEEGLRNLGINVEKMLEVYPMIKGGLPVDPAQTAFIEDTMREASFNFVNDAIVLPQSANRPLIYQDPRFALFTQFQGFMATFTATQIPKLWGDYVKRGTPAMKYNAFALAVTMIGMGFLSQHLKDLIKYGQKSPHVEGADYFQRGVRSSGLLGTSERVLDQFFPIYEKKSDGTQEWAWNQVSGESPALGYAEKLANSAGSFLGGDAHKGTYNALRAAPLIGPFTDLDKYLAGGIAKGEWDFKGDK